MENIKNTTCDVINCSHVTPIYKSRNHFEDGSLRESDENTKPAARTIRESVEFVSLFSKSSPPTVARYQIR